MKIVLFLICDDIALKRLKLAPPDEIEGDDLDLTDALAFREFSVKSSTEEHYKAHSNPAEVTSARKNVPRILLLFYHYYFISITYYC